MTDKIHKQEVAYGKTEDGRYLVASVNGPIFLFCEATLDEARATAQRALNFYFSEDASPIPERVSRAQRIIDFVPTRTEELIAA